MAITAGAGALDAYGRKRVANESGIDAVAITPSDSTPLTTPCRWIYVGTAGNITLVTLAGNTVLFSNVPVGKFDMATSQVKATGTTATNLVAVF